jgi:hypothetical protein
VLHITVVAITLYLDTLHILHVNLHNSLLAGLLLVLNPLSRLLAFLLLFIVRLQFVVRYPVNTVWENKGVRKQISM